MAGESGSAGGERRPREAGAAGVDVALAGGGRLVLRPPHADHERDARSDLAQLRRQEFGGREEAVVHRVVP